MYIGEQHLVVTQILLLMIAKYRFLNHYFFSIVIINSVSSIPYYRFIMLTMLPNNSVKVHMKAVGRLLLVYETCLIFSTMLSKMGVAHRITHILPCFLQCKIIFKDVLKRIHSLENILANAFIFNHTAFLKFRIADHHQRSSIVPLAFFTCVLIRLPLMSEHISHILFHCCCTALLAAGTRSQRIHP